MRILALRGANIASLTEFDIDFRAEPLRSAGLFAIVGPTGSGKSSLLDAMCLALYQKAPRLDDLSLQEGKVETRFGTIAQADIRNLLRRGCDTGFAECDFSGSDGHAYRARWGYRAPKRANAAVQEVMSLVRLDDEQVLVDSSGRKGDYQSRIESLTGLSYSQFTRTILLAQGRFAEFLRGKENERADLLERLTGTGIYTRISMRVRERTSALKLQAEQSELRLEGLSLLSPEEETALRSERERLLAELPRHEQRLDALRKFLEATARLMALEQGLVEIQARSQALAQRCQSDRIEAEAAQARLDQALEGRRILLPQLEAARALDSQREALEAGHRLHLEALALAQRQREAQQAQIAALETEAAKLEEALAIDLAWLEKHREKLAPLAAQWPLWQERLQQAASLRSRIQERRPALQAQQEQLATLTQELEGLEAKLRPMSPPEAPSPSLAQALEQARKELEACRKLLPFLECTEEIQERQARLTAWQSTHAQLDAQTQPLEATWELARLLLERTRMALSSSVSHLRASLVPEEPCPVCGSLAHPWAEGLLVPMESLLGEHEEAERLARKALETQRNARLELATRIRTEADAQTSLRSRQESLAPSAEVLGILPEAKRTRACLQETLSELEARNKEQLAALMHAQGYEQLSAQLEQGRTRLSTAQAQFQEQEKQLATASQDLEALLASLDEPFGGRAWRERWEGNPQFVPQVERSVEDFLQRTQNCETKRHQLEPLQSRLATEREHLAPREAAVIDAQTQVAESQAHLSELATRRQGLLEGRSVAQAEADQASLEERCRQELEASLRKAQDVAQEKARWDGQLAQGQEQVRSEQGTLQTLSQALATPDDSAPSLEQARAEFEALEGRIAGGRQETGRLEHQLRHQEEQTRLGASLREELAGLRATLSHWLILDEQIGSADGKKFRLIAQQFTLEILLEEANAQLQALAPRYTLKMLGQSMHFGVIDHEGFDELRPVQTLSGGETFLVSLALALGLSRLAGGTVAVESLFIDEGFGTLDGQTLRQVMAALSSLHAQGRKVGLITHVEEMKEQIPVQIRVVKQGQGASRIEVQ